MPREQKWVEANMALTFFGSQLHYDGFPLRNNTTIGTNNASLLICMSWALCLNIPRQLMIAQYNLLSRFLWPSKV